MRQDMAAYHLLEPRQLVPTEEVNTGNVLQLAEQILRAGHWTTPVTAHREELFVMDGHHRLAVAGLLGLRTLPVILLDYDRVDVTAWRDGETITPEAIATMARNRQKFPWKTTRHIFKVPLATCRIPLDDLRRSASRGTAGRASPRISSSIYPG